MIASRGQNRVFPLARVGRLGFGPSAEPEPEGKLDGCTFARTSKRNRHQPECTWNETLTDSGAPVSEAGNSGDEPGGCPTCSSMAGRNVGGTKSDDPVSHPNSGGVLHVNPSPEHPVRFTISCFEALPEDYRRLTHARRHTRCIDWPLRYPLSTFGSVVQPSTGCRPNSATDAFVYSPRSSQIRFRHF